MKIFSLNHPRTTITTRSSIELRDRVFSKIKSIETDESTGDVYLLVQGLEKELKENFDYQCNFRILFTRVVNIMKSLLSDRCDYKMRMFTSRRALTEFNRKLSVLLQKTQYVR